MWTKKCFSFKLAFILHVKDDFQHFFQIRQLLIQVRNMIIPTETCWNFTFCARTADVFRSDESNFKNGIRHSCKQEKVPENNIVMSTYFENLKEWLKQFYDDVSLSNWKFFCFAVLSCRSCAWGLILSTRKFLFWCEIHIVSNFVLNKSL